MGCVGNLIWFFCIGLVSGLSWFFVGCLWCLSIIGIPVGIQCFKIASLSFFPFGREIHYDTGAASVLLNVLWFCLSGWWLALIYAGVGIAFCATIIGIPFGIQCFKLARLGLSPFGATII